VKAMMFFVMKNKAIIDVHTGEKLGLLRHCDLKIDEKTGKIECLLMPRSKFAVLFSQEPDYVEIPWERIKKIGVDAILVEL
jgi:YlmC/YmxH family sporulation protein